VFEGLVTSALSTRNYHARCARLRSGVGGITDEGVRAVLRGCRQLRHLALPGCQVTSRDTSVTLVYV
jgi:hypothetical protein